MTKRHRYPFAYHLIAGHVERTDKTPEAALRRELFEETANAPTKVKLIYSGEFEYICRAGADIHHFYFFECQLPGKLIPKDDELIGFYFMDRDELQKLSPMSEAAKILLKKVGVIHD